ncbi:MAG: efflux RND transporter periplasmic adaptor subunit [Aquabacterium sp.]
MSHQAGLSRPTVLGLAVLAALVGWRLMGQVQAGNALQSSTKEQAVSTVSVISPTPAAGPDQLVLPGTVQAWSEAPIYARTGGYLKRWLVDIGQPVKAGQLLAEIDAPEVDQQLRQAEADLGSAEANNTVAQSTAERYRQLLGTQSVAPQDAEDKIGTAVARAAAVNSAKANLQRLKELAAFKRVVAPFDGVVTARSVDIGALVTAGGGGQPLFRVAANQKLRVYVDVPEALSDVIKPGQTAQVRIAGHDPKGLTARIVSTASAINPNSRTLQTQLALDNAHGEVLSGAYAEVLFSLPNKPDVLRVPGNGLLFRADGLSVATVDAQSRVVIKHVVQGRDFGKEVEIVNGLNASDRVIVNPSDSIADGTPVRVLASARQAGGKP